MLLRTLGALRLEGADFSRPKPLLLLAYLAVEGPKDRRYLSGLFWPGGPAPMTNLRTALSQLRRGAPGAIHGEESRLSTDVRLDVQGVLDGEALDRDAAIEDLYPGPFLEGLHIPDMGTELEEWVYATRELVAETVRAHLLTSAEGLASRGQPRLAARRTEAWPASTRAPSIWRAARPSRRSSSVPGRRAVRCRSTRRWASRVMRRASLGRPNVGAEGQGPLRLIAGSPRVRDLGPLDMRERR